MSEKVKRQAGEFCWVELAANDLKAENDFYSSLLGWKTNAHDMPEGGQYVMLGLQDSEIGGSYAINEKMKDQGIVPHWKSYVLVDNVDDTFNRAKNLDAKLIMEPFDVYEAGRMAILADPTGAGICLWQAKDEPGSQLDFKVPGNMGWFELHTDDTKAAQKFYCELFNWQTKQTEMDDGQMYTEFQLGDKSVAGMLPLSPEFGIKKPFWHIYFTVNDLQAAIEKATALGGKICYDPIDMPKVGKFTMIQDPDQAVFSLIQWSPN